MSLRLRLTLWYTAILAATLVLVCLIVYGTLSFTLSKQNNDFLNARAQQYYNALQLRAPGGRGPGNFLRDSVTIFNPDTYAQLFLPDGTLVSGTPNIPNGVILDSNLIAPVAHAGQPGGQTLRVGNLILLVKAYPVSGSADGSVAAVLELGRDVTQSQSSLAFLRGVLIVVSLAGLVAAFGAGWFLARKALRPIGRIAQTAQDIGDSRDFGRRVDYRGPRDELGQLAAAFNGMLADIQQAYHRLEEALAAQRRFVADASHELRTPLTTIRGNLGLLGGERAVTVTDRDEALADMASEAERMSRLVSNLLVLARADAGLHVHKEPVQLDDIMHEVYRQARLLNESVSLRLRDPEPVQVQGNPDYLKQLLLILVDNALKNTPPGGVVEVSDRASPGWVRLDVRDSGRGIPPDALPHIFERFYQADKSRSSGGTGLGLSIAKWIAEEHGGRIEATSALGEGSTFTVWLPCQTSDDRVETPAAEPVSAALG